MLDTKSISTPMSASLKLSATSGPEFDNPTPYGGIVSALQYVTLTRPDIAFNVNKVCQYMHRPIVEHWTVVKCILRYLKYNSIWIVIKTIKILCYISLFYVDWVGCPDDRKSTSGYAVNLGPNLVSWSSRKQHIVSRSSIEAEYKVVANATAEITWFQFLFQKPTLSTSCMV